MNRNAVSAECAHRLHSQCDYEDCACECHALRDEYQPMDGHDVYDNEEAPRG